MCFETVDFCTIFDEVPSPVSILDRDEGVSSLWPVGVYLIFTVRSKQKYLIDGLKDFTVFGKTIVGLQDQ